MLIFKEIQYNILFILVIDYLKIWSDERTIGFYLEPLDAFFEYKFTASVIINKM